MTTKAATTKSLEGKTKKATKTRITLYWSESLETWVTTPQDGANKLFISLKEAN